LGVSNEKAEVENGFIKYIPAKYKDQMEDQISHAYVRSVP
jgi:predicted Ser/Thr protein kinase